MINRVSSVISSNTVSWLFRKAGTEKWRLKRGNSKASLSAYLLTHLSQSNSWQMYKSPSDCPASAFLKRGHRLSSWLLAIKQQLLTTPLASLIGIFTALQSLHRKKQSCCRWAHLLSEHSVSCLLYLWWYQWEAPCRLLYLDVCFPLGVLFGEVLEPRGRKYVTGSGLEDLLTHPTSCFLSLLPVCE